MDDIGSTYLSSESVKHHVSRTRVIAAAVVAYLAAIVLIPGLIDPVEGSLPLIIGGALLLASWLIGRVHMPALTWMAWIVTFTSGAVTLVVVLIRQDFTSGSAGEGILSLHPAILIPLIVYELGVMVTIGGAVWNAVRLTRHARHARD